MFQFSIFSSFLARSVRRLLGEGCQVVIIGFIQVIRAICAGVNRKAFSSSNWRIKHVVFNSLILATRAKKARRVRAH